MKSTIEIADALLLRAKARARADPQAHTLMQALCEGDAPWAIPWPCVYEFHSVVTNPRIWKEKASTPVQAWAQIDAWCGSPSLRLLSETGDFLPVLGPLARGGRIRGPVVHDARIAAL